jgi:glutamate synthase domain-containing protein 3
VFALQEGDVSIGLVASEKQAIDATLHSLAEEDSRFRLVADRYWNARGGSHTDGGAFVFTVNRDNGHSTISCTDKFGTPVLPPQGDWTIDLSSEPSEEVQFADAQTTRAIAPALASRDPQESFSQVVGLVASWGFEQLQSFIKQVETIGQRDNRDFDWAIGLLSLLNDRHYDCGGKKRSVVLQIVHAGLDAILDAVPSIADGPPSCAKRIDWDTRGNLRAPKSGETTLVIFARDFPPEGDGCDSRLAVEAYELGWKRFIVYGLRGQRFAGCGFGPETDDVRIDIFGSSGDYLASGIDGLEIHVHGNAQDQLGQIIKRGTLVVHGDVGQTFMYGAKGGEVYILGNAAGRPLINAVGRPRVVINGTCLDFLAESFMAGDPHNGGGFVVLNGIGFDDHGHIQELESPYPGSNLFSLASGGAIFVRDPHRKLADEQLNGGEFAEFDEADWQLILPYLEANERHFGISIENDLLTVDSSRREPGEVYRKVHAIKLAVLGKSKE